MSKDGAWGFDKPEEKEGQRIQEFTVDKDDPRLDSCNRVIYCIRIRRAFTRVIQISSDG